MKQLKFYFLLALFSISMLSCEKKQTINEEEEKLTIPANIKLGDFFAGGYVFYLKPDKSGGLVFAPSDVSENPVPWGCRGLQIPILSTEVGEGKNNTETILSLCKETNIAAKLCDLYISGGYSDWFLPSVKELGLIVGVADDANTNVSSEHKLSPQDYYWTSTRVDDIAANVIMGKGQIFTGKFRDEKHRVRAARAF